MIRSSAFAQRQTVLILVAAAALAITGWIMLRPRSGVPVYKNWYFLDTASGKLFSAPVSTPSPTKSASGNEAVHAFIYSCSACADAAAMPAGYLERTSPESLEAAKKLAGPVPPEEANRLREAVRGGRQIRRFKETDWVSAESPAGQAILAEASKPCSDGTIPEICAPK